MPAALDYASPPPAKRWRLASPRDLPNVPLGVVACIVAVTCTVAILYLSYDARMGMVMARGEWCGTPAARAESRLWTAGFLLPLPGLGYWCAWLAKVGVPVCRTSLAVAVIGWLVHVLS